MLDRIENVYPFIEKAKILKQHAVRVSLEEVFIPGGFRELATSLRGQVKKSVPNRIIFRQSQDTPYIWMGSDEDLLQIIAYPEILNDYSSLVLYVDYNSIKEQIDLVENNGKWYATLPVGFGSEVIEVPGPGVFMRNGVEDTNESTSTETSQYRLDELDFSDLTIKPVVGTAKGASPIYATLENYLTGNYQTNRVPMLVGPSGVAKSASIKALAKKYNMRVVDLRLAFMSRLDIEGLSSVSVGDDGQFVSQSCPSSMMVECSDGYIEYCRKCVTILENALKDPKNETQSASIELALKKYREGAKTPILFLDEVTRAPMSVRQAFTKILTDKKFMDYDMSIARVVAATNAALGASDDLKDSVFLVENEGDGAYFDRFMSIPVYPEDVKSTWFEWAQSENSDGNPNIHEMVTGFLKHNKNYIYDWDALQKVYDETGDETVVTSSPFPNYRTWEMVSRHLYAMEQDKRFDSSTINGLVGEEAADKLIEYLESFGWKKRSSKSQDKLMERLELGMKSNVPVLMITPSAIGKSSRIKQLAKKFDCELVDLNLSEQDRTDLLGIPANIPVTDFVLEGVDGISPELRSKLVDTIDSCNVPEQVSIKAPRRDIIRRLKACAASGKPVIVHYDELTRVSSPALMSAVFESISDDRVLGVTFPPGVLRVFASANMGENYQDTQGLDPAFAARFSIYKSTQYTAQDVKSFLKYVKESGKFPPEIQKYLESQDTKRLIEILSSVETRTAEMSAASTRAWEDLAKDISSGQGRSVIVGSILIASHAEVQALSRYSQAPNDVNFRPLEQIISANIANWAAAKGGLTVKVNGEVVTASELKDLWMKHCKEPYSPAMHNLVMIMMKLDIKTRNLREKMFQFHLGDASVDFANAYNEMSGRSLEADLDIVDVVDYATFDKYVNQKIRDNASKPVALVVFQSIVDYLECHKDIHDWFVRDSIKWALDNSLPTDQLIQLASEIMNATHKSEFKHLTKVVKVKETNFRGKATETQVTKNLFDLYGELLMSPVAVAEANRLSQALKGVTAEEALKNR